MRYLLDTNVVSELRRPHADPHVFAWVAARPGDDLAISAISVMELEIGVGRVERRDRRQGLALREWLEGQVLDVFRGRILPFDLASAQRAASLQVPDPRPDRDAMIASTALAHNLVVVTRNTSDFAPMLADLVDPWVAAG